MFVIFRDRTIVVVATVTDDERVLEVPKLTVAALRFTEAARARIVKAGGTCMTIDELIMQTPSGMWFYFLFVQIRLSYYYNRHQLPAP